MIPVHMGIMAPAPTVMVSSMAVVSKPPVPKKDIAAMRAKDNDENSGPTTTVFVGNISEKASDMLIRQLLAVSGRTVFTHVTCIYTVYQIVDEYPFSSSQIYHMLDF